jgi:phosphatidylserine/phosphatidylglycerophosphate/cardiolipin synthase-like enzyme
MLRWKIGGDICSTTVPSRETGRRETGWKFFCDGEQTLHAKNVTVDGGLVSVGSYNIDRWSSQHNLEANVADMV